MIQFGSGCTLLVILNPDPSLILGHVSIKDNPKFVKHIKDFLRRTVL
jgi:hypothetical protein